MRMRHAAQTEAIEAAAVAAASADAMPGDPGTRARGQERFVEFSEVVKIYPIAQRVRRPWSTAST